MTRFFQHRINYTRHCTSNFRGNEKGYLSDALVSFHEFRSRYASTSVPSPFNSALMPGYRQCAATE